MNLAKLEHLRTSKDQLAEGLHMLDFEQVLATKVLIF